MARGPLRVPWAGGGNAKISAEAPGNIIRRQEQRQIGGMLYPLQLLVGRWPSLSGRGNQL